MSNECDFSIPEDASREDLIASIISYHEYAHELEDRISAQAAYLYECGLFAHSLSDALVESNRLGLRRALIRVVAQKLTVIGAMATMASGVDPAQIRVDDQFARIVADLEGQDD